MNNNFTMEYLRELQSYPLDLKISLTKARVREWINKFGTEGVYISFSGGKDSTVLLDIVRGLYPKIEAVFVDVPTQYPELKEFVKTFDNVTILKPKINFAQVCKKYGFPLISKEVSESVEGARKYLTQVINEYDALTDRQISYRYFFDKVTGQGKYNKGNIPSDFNKWLETLLNNRMKNRAGGNNQRLAIVLGWLTKDHENPVQINNQQSKNNFTLEKYRFFLEAPFEISNKCCNVMKKAPIHEYERKTGKVGITAQMAEESKLRTQKWLQNGCNAFDGKHKISNPMSFWTEQDVLQYIRTRDLKICSVYGNIVEDSDIDGQLSFTDIPEWDDIDFSEYQPKLKTTGCTRTGCMLCGFGCHLEKNPNRFEMLKQTHSKMYDLLDHITNNGYTMRQAIDWINEHGNMNIKY